MKNSVVGKNFWHKEISACISENMCYNSPCYGGLAQLVRAPASHAGGHWFESSSLHHRHLRKQVPFSLQCS